MSKGLLIHTKNGWSTYLKELIEHRELLYFFAWRDILVRYRQAVFGVAWALFRPLLNMLVFAFVFGRIAHLSSDQVNYPLFVLAAALPWQLFANTAGDTCQCLLNNAPLITKIYFPRMVIPLAQIILHSLEFVITGIVLFALCIAFNALNFLTLLSLPLFLIMLYLLCAGVSLWLSALTIQFRDLRLIAPFFIQFGMFVSPVGYGSFLIPESWRWLYFLNPMVGIIDGFRFAFFGIYYPQCEYGWMISSAISLLIFFTGVIQFRKMERYFADLI